MWHYVIIVRWKGDKRQAIEVYGQAAEIYEKLGRGNENPTRHKCNAALTCKNIGAIFQLENDHQKALEFFQKALLYHKENAASAANDVSARIYHLLIKVWQRLL